MTTDIRISDITIAEPTAMVVFDEPTEWVDRGLETASAWNKYEIQPGAYAFEWVNIDYRPWNADPNAKTLGFIGNTGPYYGLVRMRARLIESYYENRLWTATAYASSAVQVEHTDAQITDLTGSVYAYELPNRPHRPSHGRPLEFFRGGRVVPYTKEA